MRQHGHAKCPSPVDIRHSGTDRQGGIRFWSGQRRCRRTRARNAVRSPTIGPPNRVAGVSSELNFRSEAVSGASSHVSTRNPSGSASLWMVRSVRQILAPKRTTGVGQVVLVAQRSNTHRDLRVAVTGQVGEQVVLDLETQVAARKCQQRTSFEVRGAQHLPQVPLGSGFMFQDVRSEFLRTVREMATEDHHVRPKVAQQVRCRVCDQGSAPAGSAERREEHIVLDGLAGNLPEQRPCLSGLFGRWPIQIDIVQGDAPFECSCQKQVLKRLQQMRRSPGLVAGYPHHPEAEIIVHAENVAEHMVAVVVRGPPLRGHRDHVPLPRARVNLRIVHPIPLAMAHVVANFHVLDTLRKRQRRGPQHPACPSPAGADEQARRHIERPLEPDGAPDIGRVALAE